MTLLRATLRGARSTPLQAEEIARAQYEQEFNSITTQLSLSIKFKSERQADNGNLLNGVE